MEFGSKNGSEESACSAGRSEQKHTTLSRKERLCWTRSDGDDRWHFSSAAHRVFIHNYFLYRKPRRHVDALKDMVNVTQLHSTVDHAAHACHLCDACRRLRELMLCGPSFRTVG